MCFNFLFHENKPQKRPSMSCKYSLEKLIKGRAWQSHYYVYVKFNSAKKQMPLVLSQESIHTSYLPTTGNEKDGGGDGGGNTEQTTTHVREV